MQYLYHNQAGQSTLLLQGDDHRYLFKVRRHRQGESIALRNLQDEMLYWYRIETLTKRDAMLMLHGQEHRVVKSPKKLHLGWCVIDPKKIERVLPTLNEMGVEAITFIYCARSQKQFKIDLVRLEKILLNSSQQSGRSTLMKLAVVENLQGFLDQYPESVMLNFSDISLDEKQEVSVVLVGSEGGFTPQEEALVNGEQVVGLATPLILRSESAVCAVSAKVLL